MSLNEILASSAIPIEQRPWSNLAVASVLAGSAPGLVDHIVAGSITGSGVLTAQLLVNKFATADLDTPYTLVTDTAIDIIDLMTSETGFGIGAGFEFVLLNGDQGGTITAGAGVTILGGSLNFQEEQSVVRFFVLYDAEEHITIWPSLASYSPQPIPSSPPGLIDFSSQTSFSSSGTISNLSLCAKLGTSAQSSVITLTTDSAANIILAMGNGNEDATSIGNSFTYSYSNTGSAAVIIAPGTGVTLGSGGNFTIPPLSEATYSVNRTGTSAIHFYELSRSGPQLGYTANISGSVMDGSTFIYSQMANSIVQTALTMNTTVTIDTAANLFAAQSLVGAPYPGYTVRGKIVNNAAFTLSFDPPGDLSVTVVDAAGTGVVPANVTRQTDLVLISVGPPIYAFYL